MASAPEPGAPGPDLADALRRFGPAAALAVAALLFVIQNTERITFEFLWLDFRWPMWVMLVAFALVGALAMWVVQRRRRRE